jgi:signal transduction histidine kinase
VPASVGLSAYRMAQEALTNTMKHAGAGSASVRVTIGQGGLELRVSDDGHGDPDRLHPGRGILGMSERAAMRGGRVSLDRDGEGRFTVSARLAWEPAP